MSTAIKLIAWFVTAMIIWNITGGMISAPSNISLALGVIIWVIFLYISFKTKLFTVWKR